MVKVCTWPASRSRSCIPGGRQLRRPAPVMGLSPAPSACASGGRAGEEAALDALNMDEVGAASGAGPGRSSGAGHFRKIAARLFGQTSYASEAAFRNSLNDQADRHGWKVRDRIAATVAASTTHGLAPRRKVTQAQRDHRRRQRRARGEVRGVRCEGIVTQRENKGERRSRAALAGSAFCPPARSGAPRRGPALGGCGPPAALGRQGAPGHLSRPNGEAAGALSHPRRPPGRPSHRPPNVPRMLYHPVIQ